MKSKFLAFDIPVWVEWIAQNSDGNWYGYQCKPRIGRHRYLPENGYSAFVWIAKGDQNVEWKETLEKVEE